MLFYYCFFLESIRSFIKKCGLVGERLFFIVLLVGLLSFFLWGRDMIEVG